MDVSNRNPAPLQPGQSEVTRGELDIAAKRRRRAERRKEELDDALDLGLEQTFPGSDPVALTQPPHSVCDKRRP
jgi:hypothetical protein